MPRASDWEFCVTRRSAAGRVAEAHLPRISGTQLPKAIEHAPRPAYRDRSDSHRSSPPPAVHGREPLAEPVASARGCTMQPISLGVARNDVQPVGSRALVGATVSAAGA